MDSRSILDLGRICRCQQRNLSCCLFFLRSVVRHFFSCHHTFGEKVFSFINGKNIFRLLWSFLKIDVLNPFLISSSKSLLTSVGSNEKSKRDNSRKIDWQKTTPLTSPLDPLPLSTTTFHYLYSIKRNHFQHVTIVCCSGQLDQKYTIRSCFIDNFCDSCSNICSNVFSNQYTLANRHTHCTIGQTILRTNIQAKSLSNQSTIITTIKTSSITSNQSSDTSTDTSTNQTTNPSTYDRTHTYSNISTYSSTHKTTNISTITSTYKTTHTTTYQVTIIPSP